jgi:hypothetical protein
MTATTNRPKQQSIEIGFDKRIQMACDVSADMRWHQHDSALSALGRVDSAAFAMREGTTNRNDLAALADVTPSQFAHFAVSQTAPGRYQDEGLKPFRFDRVGDCGEFGNGEDHGLRLGFDRRCAVDLARVPVDQTVFDRRLANRLEQSVSVAAQRRLAL